MSWCRVGLCGLYCRPRWHCSCKCAVLVVHHRCVANAPSLTVELSLRRPLPSHPAVHHRWVVIAPSIAVHCRCARGSLPCAIPCYPSPSKRCRAVPCRQVVVSPSIAVVPRRPSLPSPPPLLSPSRRPLPSCLPLLLCLPLPSPTSTLRHGQAFRCCRTIHCHCHRAIHLRHRCTAVARLCRSSC